MPNTTIMISKDRDGDSASPSLEEDLLAELARRADFEVATVAHLSDLDPHGPGAEYLRSVPGDMVVLAHLYPRAAFWLLDAIGVRGRRGCSRLSPDEKVEPTPAAEIAGSLERTIWCLDLRGAAGAGPLVAEIERIVSESIGRPLAPPDDAKASTDDKTRVEEITAPRWYPVIDYDRCTNCLECLNFCLFGVFDLDGEDRISVLDPDACRDGCPACARVCPAQAIMFPPHDNPAIAGDPNAKAADMDVTFAQLLGGVSPEDAAFAQRERCLAEKARGEQSSQRDELDRLVDELDRADL